MSIACGQSEIKPEKTDHFSFSPEMLLVNTYAPAHAPYTLDIAIEQNDDDEYFLVATIDFTGDSYIASPLSDKDFKGAFKMEVAPDKNLMLDEQIIELRSSMKANLSHDKTPEDWVNVKTTYKQKLLMKEINDFKSGGKITFTIEPKCTFEVIPFMISYKNGFMTVEPAGC